MLPGNSTRSDHPRRSVDSCNLPLPLHVRVTLAPDRTGTAKGIADGLPLSAVTGRADIMDAPHISGLGGTYGGNPIACAAALATIDTIEGDGLVARAAAIESVMKDALHRMQAEDDRIGDVRGRGAIIAMELVKSGTAEPDGVVVILDD